jgi:UDP-N-acetylglucosamine 2-epimerase (non-hydrolysing)
VELQTRELSGLDDDPRRVLLVTAHRRESWGGGMARIGEALRQLAIEDPERLIVFPLHKNPTVRDELLPRLRGLDNVVVTEPVPYGELVMLLRRSHVVLTDSGGIQEEAPGLGKPVLVMRDTTERPEGIAAGTAKLVGTDPTMIVSEVRRLFDDPEAHAAMANAVNPYGDGRAASRSIDAMAELLQGRR